MGIRPPIKVGGLRITVVWGKYDGLPAQTTMANCAVAGTTKAADDGEFTVHAAVWCGVVQSASHVG